MIRSLILRRATVSAVGAAVLLLGVEASGASEASVQGPQGRGVPALAPLYYTQHCAACHDTPELSRAPSRDALRQRTPEAIYEALTDGVMASQSSELSESQKRILATYLSGRPAGSIEAADASSMPNPCAATPLGNPLQGPLWNGWGRDVTNSRFQPNPGFAADQVSQLTLKWAFGFPNALSAYGQPLIAGGRLYVGSDAAFVYSLDAETGCVHWSYGAQSGVRTAISIGPVEGAGAARYAVYFGDIDANVYALDAETGALIWTQRADDHDLARITGAPTLYDGRLYVPVSSLEEAAGGHPTYPCCTFRGSVVAYDASSGEQLWKTYTIATEPKPTRTTSTGLQLYGPAGGAVWAAPAIDEERGVLYVTTGNQYSAPADEGTEAVIALELDSGDVRWLKQVTANDIWLVGCGRAPGAPPLASTARPPGQSETCPEPDVVGPDTDFGSNASLHRLANGTSVILAQQKSSMVWALDPDRNGEIFWNFQIGRGGSVQFGHASDGRLGYFAAPDAQFLPDLGGLFALNLATGERVWRAAPACGPSDRDCSRAHLAAVTAIPGTVFSSSADGIVRAYSTADGRVLWEYNTTREFETVNEVAANGGSQSGPGPTVAGGMVFITSGYSAIGGNPGNVLLAFGVE